MGKRGPKPKAGVDTTWRPELAYALGLIVADGSLSKNGRHIDFTSKDKEQVENFSRCLPLTGNKIGIKQNGSKNGTAYYRVQFGDVVFYKWLTTIGVMPNKSKTLGKLTVPDKYFFDFLRGFWDGDGSLYGFWDMRWKSSYTFFISFSAGSHAYLEWLQERINQKLHTNGYITAVNRGYQLRYAKSDTKKIIAAQFERKDAVCLARKFAKVREIYRIDALNSSA